MKKLTTAVRPGGLTGLSKLSWGQKVNQPFLSFSVKPSFMLRRDNAKNIQSLKGLSFELLFITSPTVGSIL